MMKYLRYSAIAGNILFLLFFFYNAIDEGGVGVTPVQMVAMIGLALLLVLNLIVLIRKR